MSHSAAVPGGKSVGVPGNLRMMALVHEEQGKLPWARLFEPAIRLARDGFEVTPRLHNALARSDHIASPWAREQFFGADATAKPVGPHLKNPALAPFLETLAARREYSFYIGPTSQDTVQTQRPAKHTPTTPH